MAAITEPHLADAYEDYHVVLSAICEGGFSRAEELLERLLARRLEHLEFFEVLKCLKFWLRRLDTLLTTEVGLARAQLLERYWQEFEAYVERYHVQAGSALGCFRYSVFTKLIESYTIALERSAYSNVDHLITVAQKLRAIGKYKEALETLSYAQKLSPHEEQLQLLYADTLYLSGAYARGYILLREWFVYAQTTTWKLVWIGAPFLWSVILTMRAEGLRETELRPWLPVYGVSSGAFPVYALSADERQALVQAWPRLQTLLEQREAAYAPQGGTQTVAGKLNPLHKEAIRNAATAAQLAQLLYTYMYLLDQLSGCLLADEQGDIAVFGTSKLQQEETTVQTLVTLRRLAPVWKQRVLELVPQLKQRLTQRYAVIAAAA